MLCSGVFFSESLTIPVAPQDAQHRLLAFLHAGDLDGIASEAYGEGETLLVRAGVAGVAKTVRVQSIPAYQRGDVLVVPIRWEATGPVGGAFPVLDANIELSGTGTQTGLALIGSYRPPLGRFGELADQLVLKSVARSTIRNFLGQLAAVARRPVHSEVKESIASDRPD